ncbi:hypothetical protein NMY22_g6674 [Coprinellus aureogranulatus]|nr:hypothetical protein NMY22_g6674 [Coprinellus aureogranulatus]
MAAHRPHFTLHEPKFVADLEERLLHRHNEHQPAAHPPRLVPTIPDLRFEFSYLRSLQPYVKITRTTEVQPSPNAASKSGSSVLGDDDDRSYEKVQFGSEPGRGESGAQLRRRRSLRYNGGRCCG